VEAANPEKRHFVTMGTIVPSTCAMERLKSAEVFLNQGYARTVMPALKMTHVWEENAPVHQSQRMTTTLAQTIAVTPLMALVTHRMQVHATTETSAPLKTRATKEVAKERGVWNAMTKTLVQRTHVTA